MPTRSFDFVNGAGNRLSGSLDMPEGICRGWALFAHCFTCGKNNLAAVRIARALAATGIGVLRFDFAGLGDSEGNFSGTSFTLNVDDLRTAAAAMAQADMAPALLIGHSLGGAAMLAAAGDIASARAVATIAAPFNVSHVLHLLDADDLAGVDADEVALVQVRGRPLAVDKAFIDDLRHHDQAARIAALHRPLLLLHSPRDHTVAVENATQIYLAARHPKSFISLDDADHLLSRREDAEHVANLIATWSSRYLPADPDPHTQAADAEAEETGLGKFQLALRSGGSRWLADEPATMGGLGSGPTPYNLLSSALAACTTMTLRHYIDTKGWAVTRIRTAVDHRKDKSRSPADVFTRRIAVEGALDDAQRAQLAEAAERCPVHRTLTQGTGFDGVRFEAPE